MPVEGFWYSKHEPDFPMPVAQGSTWDGWAQFLDALSNLETRLRGERGLDLYRGFSLCRICECANGSGTYVCDGWAWPDGFQHYVEVHNVKPSDEFIKFVTAEGVRL